MKNYRSFCCFILIVFIDFASFFQYSVWKDGFMKNGGDSWGYYCYLPAIFIHHDLSHLRYSVYYGEKETSGKIGDSTQAVHVEEAHPVGKSQVIKYTCGVAILEAPFFFLGDAVTRLSGLPADGYSYYYMFFVHLSNLLFVLGGLFLLRLLLLKYFSDFISALVLVTIAVGTNLFHFTVHNVGMSHGYLFTLYVALILATIRFFKSGDAYSAMLLGFSAGMITLIRPDEIICLFIPLFYEVRSVAELKRKLSSLLRQKEFYLAILFFAICIAPQLVYWKTMTGKWLYYSYTNEKFDFLHPKIYRGIFGFFNGWLPYTLAMVLAVAGIPLLFCRLKAWLIPVITFIPLHIYIIYSWWCWNYINGLGSRPMIETYPLLALPMGLLFSVLFKNFVTRALGVMVVIFFSVQQMMMTWQSAHNLLCSEVSTRTFYLNTLFKTSLSMQNLVEFDINENQPHNLKYDHLLWRQDFEDSLNKYYVRNGPGMSGNFSFLLDSNSKYMPGISRTVGQCELKPGQWLRISFEVRKLCPAGDLYRFAAMLVDWRRGGRDIHSNCLRIQNKIQKAPPLVVSNYDCNISGHISYYTCVPRGIKPDDSLIIFGKNLTDAPVLIDNVTIEAWQLQ